MNEYKIKISDSEQMIVLGQQLASVADDGLLIYLYGDLGTGKTTFARGFIQARGRLGKVKSPTYTLVETYNLEPPIYHFDLYRLADPEELDYLGLSDYLHQPVIWLLEWPEQGGDYLPVADLSIYLSHQGTARDLRLQAHSNKGITALTIFKT